MAYHYLAFGIPIISEIELPALLPTKEKQNNLKPLYVKVGIVPAELSGATQADEFTYCTENETICSIPGKIKFYISNSDTVIIEPVAPDYSANLLYFYSNGLAAALYQRNLIPFHVSGVFVEEGKVALFAAPSRTGKSTLALKLRELGFKPFTDDTAILSVENGKCYAQASYPMMRLWQNTLSQQALLGDEDKQKIYAEAEIDKYGFSFHEQFTSEAVEVKQILFLKEEGSEIQVQPVKNVDAFVALSNNVYRCHWVPAMQKSRLQFFLITRILEVVPHILVKRPRGLNSFEQFPLAVKNILQIDSK
ncbi:MAG: hypothetical protein J7539_17620 [Niabella sp.]|nr:hypothetical protein [Niabella sp.]